VPRLAAAWHLQAVVDANHAVAVLSLWIVALAIATIALLRQRDAA
jgi:hypothetical protein